MASTQLRRLATFKNSNVDKKSYEDQNAVKLCNYTDVYYNDRIRGDMEFMDATAAAAEIAQFALQKGDVIITKDSETADDIGVPALVDEDLPGVICGYHLTMLKAGHKLAPEYLFYVLKSENAIHHFATEAKGVTRMALGQNGIATLPIPVLPMVQQREITAFLDKETARIDALIQRKLSQGELLRERAANRREHLVRRGMQPAAVMEPTGLAWRGDAPSNWTLTPLKRLLAPIVQPVDVQADGWYREIGIRSHGRGIFHKERISGEELGNKRVFWVKTGCLAFNIVFAWERAVAVTTSNERGFIASHRFPMYQATDSVCDVRYLKHLFTTPVGHPLLEFHSPGAAGRNKTLSLPKLLAEKIPMPPVEEQRAIADAIEQERSTLTRLAKAIDASAAKLKERRQALITQAVTGQFKIPVEEIHAQH